MYELHYLVPTAGGNKSEKVLRCGDYMEYLDATLKCENCGYEILMNPMCKRCALLGKECAGEDNFVWTGCVRRKAAAE